MKKWVLVFIYSVFVTIAFIYKEEITNWIRNQEGPQIFPILLVAIFLALVPVIPYGVIAAVIGARYGFLFGGIMNVIASTVAAAIMFVLVRFVFTDVARIWMSRYERIEKFTIRFEKSPFLAVLFARLIPVIPAQVVNVYAAVSRTPLSNFILATIVGKVPVMITFALVGDQLLNNPSNIVAVIVIYLIFLLIVWGLYHLLIRIRI